MTDTEHDGWPDKYRDPRDRPHPEVLRVTVERFDEMRDGTVEAAVRSLRADSHRRRTGRQKVERGTGPGVIESGEYRVECS